MNAKDSQPQLDVLHVGFDVHRDTIAACVLNASTGEIVLEQQLKNQPAAVARLIRRIRNHLGEPCCCYEASSCGFILFRQLRDLSVECEVIAPSSIPRRSGDRIKTDRRDAEKLATMHAAGLLTGIEVPDPELESTRAMLRCRQSLVDELTRTKHRATQFLQTRGLVYRDGTNWSQRFWLWLAKVEINEVGSLLAELDPCVYVIDCLPNMDDTMVAERTVPLVLQLRTAHPDTPILLVEDRTFANAPFLPSRRSNHRNSRAAFKVACLELLDSGVEGLYYLEGDDLIGHDAEGTTDGSHPNDLGMLRYANAYEPVLRSILR